MRIDVLSPVWCFVALAGGGSSSADPSVAAQATDAAAGRTEVPDGLTPQQAYLKASNTDPFDFFGFSVASSGDTVVVSAYGEDSDATGVNGDQSDNSASTSGAVYVFVRSGTSWSQQAYLKASNTEAGDLFGHSVSVSGDTLVVGAPFESSDATGVNGGQSNNGASRSGAAYVFVRSGTTWSQQAYFKASNTEAGDFFGSSVTVSGDTVVIGAPLEASNATGVNGDQSNDGAPGSGASYVFVRSGTSWSQQAYVKASNTGSDDMFGISVSLSGETAVVGAHWEDSDATGVNGDQDDNGAPAAGAVYVFARNGTSWSQQAYLKASNTNSFDEFGFSVSVSGDTVVAGAREEDSRATGVNGEQGDNGAPASGAAYVFERSGTSWSQQAYLKASNTGEADAFGHTVSTWGDTVVVGAYQEDSLTTGADDDDVNSGAAYVFERQGTSWSQQAFLKASNTGDGDLFGTSVAASGTRVVVGATAEDSNATGVNGVQRNEGAQEAGAAYVFDACLLASVAFRNSESNPASYVASPLVLGAIFSATVDNGSALQLTSLLFAFDSAFSLTLGGGQTLLCLDLGSGELWTGGGLAPASTLANVDSYSLMVPGNLAFCGLTVYSQAIQFGNPPFVFSNAQDLTIGSF